MNLYKEIFGNFEAAEIKYLIVGGVAVNLYGHSRFTGDIDIILALDNGNLEKLDKLMKKMGYIERLPVSVKELGDEKKLEKFIQEKGMKACTFISNEKPQLDIDIVIEESVDFKKYEKAKAIIHVWEMELPVIGIDDLKRFRKKANIDIEQLRRGKYSSPESKLEWLYSALCFAQAKKKIVFPPCLAGAP